MKELLQNMITSWQGIVIIVFLFVAILILLSAVFYRQFFKRFYDVLISGFALLVLSPLLLFLIILGTIKMKGNPFFFQMRPGKINKKSNEEKIFRLIKFRSMTCEKNGKGELLPDEKRLTKYGKFLRNSSLDELPELINIFKGDMSIIGPRPQLVKDMMFMNQEERRRHLVRPGLSGLAQVSGRNNITWEQKFEYDLEYADHGISFFNDIKIIFKTIFKVLKKSDTVREGTASDIDFGEWLLLEGKINQEKYDYIMEEFYKMT